MGLASYCTLFGKVTEGLTAATHESHGGCKSNDVNAKCRPHVHTKAVSIHPGNGI